MGNGTAKVLVVDDEPQTCAMLVRLVAMDGYVALQANDGPAGLLAVRTETPDALLLDVRMPGMDGFEVLARVRELDPNIPVIMMTGYAELREAVHAMKSGAFDYIAKPLEPKDLIRVLRRAMDDRDRKLKLRQMSSQLNETTSLSKMMGPSETITRLIGRINRVAKSDFTVIISGETGSGKELAARAIHYLSHRSNGPFVAIDCGAIPETLLEDELFGHEKGAFTGAVQHKPGKFEAARDGTLFLDEISNMTLGAQAKLLRALQERIICRVGGIKSFGVDVRVLVSCNQDLSAPAEKGSFRRDLFYRLNDFTLHVPTLRERKEDIPYLASRFLGLTNIELGKRVTGLSDSAIKAMLAYDWPGNVRQLRSVVRRAVLLADEIITEKELDIRKEAVATSGGLQVAAVDLRQRPWEKYSLKEMIHLSSATVERRVLEEVLGFTGGNKARAARLLQIDYKTIHAKIKQLGISA